MQDKVLILDFGSQYTQLIARRVRELEVYCEIVPFNKVPELDSYTKAIILSGSPFSVRQEDSPRVDLERLINHAPLLGVCYGAQLLSQSYDGNVAQSDKREYGRAHLDITDKGNVLFQNVSNHSQIWMSHGDTIQSLGEKFTVTASSDMIPVAAFSSVDDAFKNPVHALQFHPEVYHSTEGTKILSNFLFKVCKLKKEWTASSFVNDTIASLKEQLGNDEVILGLSGGVDSSVAALLLHKAIGANLKCIFVDNGLLRKNEFENVLIQYQGMGLNVDGVRASDLFLGELRGVTDPEKKRKIIGKLFIDVFAEEAKMFKNAKWLAQGTIYPDVIESISVKGPSATIKSHHNVGGLPEKLHLKIVEPLKYLFKDEVRKAGAELDLYPEILNRHPFPGPGLAVRILGEITPERVKTLQEADDIFISGLKSWGLYDSVWQAGAILTPINSVGVMGDERTYENVAALRAVHSTDGMTADWVHLPYDFLAKVSNDIINNVRGINRVVYDISSKPPATIEWE
jgi:GMP synthase (glutamine-hydrolysing)